MGALRALAYLGVEEKVGARTIGGWKAMQGNSVFLREKCPWLTVFSDPPPSWRSSLEASLLVLSVPSHPRMDSGKAENFCPAGWSLSQSRYLTVSRSSLSFQ